MKDMAESVLPPQPRDYAGFNWTGFSTLYLQEVRRFWKVGPQTIAAPGATALPLWVGPRSGPPRRRSC